MVEWGEGAGKEGAHAAPSTAWRIYNQGAAGIYNQEAGGGARWMERAKVKGGGGGRGRLAEDRTGPSDVPWRGEGWWRLRSLVRYR